jgi:hypothetical protein
MRRTSQDLYDGIGTWKRRPIRAGKKTYMPSHKRWGKITVTKMTPVPEGEITTTEDWGNPTKMVTVTCYHCAKVYKVVEAEVRTNNYCVQCK